VVSARSRETTFARAVSAPPAGAARRPADEPVDARADDAPAIEEARPAPRRDGPAVARRARVRGLPLPLRAALALTAIACAVAATLAGIGQPLRRTANPPVAYPAAPHLAIVAKVRPLTSLLVPRQYDTKAQFDTYSGAACSPTSMAEVLTAWGVPDATIGRLIDALGRYLSPDKGLLDQAGFEYAAARYHYRADISWSLSYNQVLFMTNTLGIPVIVNVRRDYGYYRYLAGGHFLVVTGGDQRGLRIVDSSEYYIKYLSKADFMGLWQWKHDGSAMTVVLVPQDMGYPLPRL
jgi:hypothetical protein